jgi:non-specific protein-tyrosine kinase
MEPQQILRIVRRRAWKVVLCGVVVAVAVGAASHYFQKPVYETSAQVLWQPNNSAQSVGQQSQAGAIDLPTYAASQLTIAHSIAVAEAASKAMPGHPSPDLLLSQVSVVADPTSGVLTIVAKSGDRVEAQAAANAFARAYIATSYSFALGNLKSAVATIQPQLDRMLTQLTNLDAQIVKASRTKGGSASAATAGLKTRRQVVWAQYNTLLATQEGLSTSIQLTRQQAVLVAAAGLPGTPISPKPLKDALLGATAGLLIGLGIELLREKFDDKVNTAEEIEEITAHPLLAQIPKDAAVAGTASPVVIRPGEFSEAVRALRTGLQFLGVDRPLRRIVVSSAGTGDGKTTVAAHLAVAYAEAGFVTVLISGDLRRPQVESLFGSTNTGPGLSSLLATGPLRPRTAVNLTAYEAYDTGFASNGNGHTNGNGQANGNGNGNGHYATETDTPEERSERLTEFLRLLALGTGVENLTVIPAGPMPPNPAELLGSARMRETLDALGEHADVIIIDTPPALVVTDSVVLAGAADGVVLVLSAAKSTRADLKRLMAIYETAEVPVLGTVLNRARSRGKNEYYRAYTSTPSQPKRVSRWSRQKETEPSV